MIVYDGIFEEDGNVVGEDVALSYALERIRNGRKEEQEEFVKWYFSGNWIEKEEEV